MQGSLSGWLTKCTVDIADNLQLRDIAMATIFGFVYMGVHIGATWQI